MVRALAEDTALRKGTAEFIASDPDVVTMERPQRVPDGAGGWVSSGEPVPLGSQIVKMQPLSLRGSPQRTSEAGQVYTPTHVLLGMPDLDAMAGDRFVWNGAYWSVVFVDKALSYRIMAEVIHSGSYSASQ